MSEERKIGDQPDGCPGAGSIPVPSDFARKWFGATSEERTIYCPICGVVPASSHPIAMEVKYV